jgi:hypothetical protein
VCAGCSAKADGVRRKPVSTRVVPLDDLRLSDEAWLGLGLPVGLVFFYRRSKSGEVVARYPSAAGGTEAVVSAAAWASLERDNAAVSSLEPDVEALLVHRLGGRRESFLAPIDACWELVGRVRAQRGAILAGPRLHETVAGFVGELRRRARGSSCPS